MDFWNFKAHPLWHTFSIKAVSPNLQAVPPSWAQAFKYMSLLGPCSFKPSQLDLKLPKRHTSTPLPERVTRENGPWYWWHRPMVSAPELNKKWGERRRQTEHHHTALCDGWLWTRCDDRCQTSTALTFVPWWTVPWNRKLKLTFLKWLLSGTLSKQGGKKITNSH